MTHRYLFLLLGIFIAGLTAGAKDIRDSEVKKISWAMQVWFDANDANKLSYFNNHGLDLNGFGFSAGVAMRCHFNKHWYLQPGLLAAYDTEGVRVADFGTLGDNVVARIGRGACLLPLNLGYTYHVSYGVYMSVYFGGMLSYGFAGSVNYEPQEASSSLPGNLYGPNAVWNRISAGPKLGFTLEGDNIPLSFMIDVYVGATQMARRDIFRYSYVNETMVRFGLSYWFGRSKQRHYNPGPIYPDEDDLYD